MVAFGRVTQPDWPTFPPNSDGITVVVEFVIKSANSPWRGRLAAEGRSVG